jgi:protein-S-isoprenylcysteine O-methyltransferase Ste14
VHTIATSLVILCWLVYLPMFIGKSGPNSARARKNSRSQIGILLQFAAVGITWVWRRPLFSPLPSIGPPVSVVAPIIAVLLAAGAVWFSWIALRTLGKQWSFVAGVTAQHRLIQDGPYAIVRHPLYVCFFGLTLATGMVWTEPAAIAVSVVLFWIGVWVRVRTEEKLLRDAFGEEFERYVQRVPAFFPRSSA